MIFNKLVSLFVSFLLLAVSIVFLVYLNGDIGKNFKRDIYALSLANGSVKKIETLNKPVMSAITIGANIKKNVSIIESPDISDMNLYFSNIEPFFDDAFFEKFKADKMKEIEALLNGDVRVVSFVVTEDPILVGVDLSQNKATWLFYVKGVYKREGIFSKTIINNTFGEKEIWFYIQESSGQNGNPSGLKIVNYK